MLRRFSIATRLFGLVGLVILFAAVALVCDASIFSRLERTVVLHTQSVLLEAEKGKIKAAAHSMALTLAEGVKSATSDEERADRIRRMLAPVRYEDDASGYYFAYRGTTNVALPPQPNLEGKDLTDFADRDGVYYVRELARQAHAGGGFVRYVFPKPSGTQERKMSYSEMIPGTDFWVGTGVYIDNVNREMAQVSGMIGSMFKQALTASGAVFVAMVGVLCALCLAIARSVARPMAEATQAAERIAGGDLDVHLNAVGNDEASRLQAALNDMTTILRRNIQEIHARREEAEEKAAQAQQALEEVRRAEKEIVAQVALRVESLQKISLAVAHQLRNPTTIIGGLAGLLMKKPSLQQHYLDYLDGIIEAARRIERIAVAVREYSSIHLGHASGELAGPLLAEGRKAGGEVAKSLGRSVVWEMEGEDVTVVADGGLLAMALRELAANAVEALPPEGGSVRLSARAMDGGTEVSVADTGRGLTEEERQYVLDPFYTTKAVGVGMGLTKVQRVAQEHGGTLAIESEPGKGTIMRLTLPGR